MVILIIMLFLMPIAYLVNSIGTESYVVYNVFRQKIGQGQIFIAECTEGFFCNIINPVGKFFMNPEVSYYMKQAGSKINKTIFDYSTNFIFLLPSILLQVGIFLFTFFYFLRDGEGIIKYTKDFLPLEAVHQNHLMKKTKETIDAVVYGNFVTAFLQGLLGGFVFYFWGFNSPLFWGTVIFVFSLVPVMPWLIFGPASLYLILDGFASASNSIVFKGIMLFAAGCIVITFMDGVVKPYLIGTRAKMPTLVIILGLIAGVQWFGFVGLFIGPVILTFLLGTFEIYQEMKHQEK